MCKFCEFLKSDKMERLLWHTRSTFADSNLEEFLEEKSGYEESYIQNYSDFQLVSHSQDGDAFVGIYYREEVSNSKGEKVIISPFSEIIQFNYCPMCGEQVSKEVKTIKRCLRGMVKFN